MAETGYERAALRRTMIEKLDIDDVRTASFDLGISYDDLSGDTKSARVLSLIERVERRNRGAELIAWLRENRPDQAWPDPFNLLVIESPIHLELVRVPAGEFLMGSDPAMDERAYDDEKPQHHLNLAEFFIGKYPVTVSQFSAFVKAAGHKTSAERQGSGWAWQSVEWANWRHPSGPRSNVSRKADHPVTQVSWQDAVAFCHWLSESARRSFRLPTEAEWEKAARGTDGRLYPWGSETPNERLCNFVESDVDDTTPVGQYYKGASPYGALDMAGNVQEWTSSLFRSYPYDERDGREGQDKLDTEERVVRGGDFISTFWVVRCAFRRTMPPDFGNWCTGFRVAASFIHP